MKKESPDKVNIVFNGENININTGEWNNNEASIHACPMEEIDISSFIETLKEHPCTVYMTLNDGTNRYVMLWAAVTEAGNISLPPMLNAQDRLATVTVK